MTFSGGASREALAAAWRAEEAMMLQRAEKVHESTVEEIHAELHGALTEISFVKNTATIVEPEGHAAIQQIAHVLRKHASVHVRVEGHAARGESKPSKLSDARAQVAMHELRGAGITLERMVSWGCGAVGKGMHAFVEVARIEQSKRVP
jgi:outer membrane protein OmpA-like peptidoglycan-associated protein